MEGLYLGGSSLRLPISVLTGSHCSGRESFASARVLCNDPSSIDTGADSLRPGGLV